MGISDVKKSIFLACANEREIEQIEKIGRKSNNH